MFFLIERHWPDLRGLKHLLQLYFLLEKIHCNWKTLTRFKGIETNMLIYISHAPIYIERHWPDLRGLKHLYHFLLISIISLSNWKTLTRFKGIETPFKIFLSSFIITAKIERHWPDLRGLKQFSLTIFLSASSSLKDIDPI